MIALTFLDLGVWLIKGILLLLAAGCLLSVMALIGYAHFLRRPKPRFYHETEIPVRSQLALRHHADAQCGRNLHPIPPVEAPEDRRAPLGNPLINMSENTTEAQQPTPHAPVGLIDRKFVFTAVNPVTRNFYTQDNALILCAKDLAAIPALKAYVSACEAIGAKPSHIASIRETIRRVEGYQANVERRVPDTEGAELERCLPNSAVFRDLALLPSIDSLTAESQEIQARIASLQAYRNNADTLDLDVVERADVDNQLRAMVNYLSVLELRIKRATTLASESR